MFGRIRRFFIAFRALRQRARENQQIRKELNLNSMGYLVKGLVPKPQGKAKADTVCLSYDLLDKTEATLNSTTDQILEESKIPYNSPCSGGPGTPSIKKDMEQRLDEHEKKFRG